MNRQTASDRIWLNIVIIILHYYVPLQLYYSLPPYVDFELISYIALLCF